MDIILDTNIVLHFRRIDELDWCDLAKVSSCSIVVTPVLMRELERNKVQNPNTRLRERARGAILWIGGLLGNEDPIQLRDGVTLVFAENEPLIDFAEHQLSRDIADDHLIASALDWGRRSGNQIAIATEDTGLALKLRSRPIQRLMPAEEWRLPDAVDAERAEIRELKRELERERNRRPKLVAQFVGGGTKISVSPEPLEAPPTLDCIRAELLPMTFDEYTSADDRTEPGVRIYSREPVVQYNRELEVFFNEYAAYLARYEAWMELESRTIELGIVLGNVGTSPASNIDIKLSFPINVEIMAADDGTDEPAEPVPPSKPHPHSRAISMVRMTAPRVPSATANLPREGQADISWDKLHADYFVGALKHDCANELEPLLVRFADATAMKPFAIQVTITCNETDRVTDELIVLPCRELETMPSESQAIIAPTPGAK
jgi:rRNA-processing protein FCF1